MDSIDKNFESGYDDPIEDMELYERLIIKGLTKNQKRIYNLITHDCLEYDEVASRLNMTVEAVRMNMSRARRRIAENIKKMDQ